jgi:hypothetical protein
MAYGTGDWRITWKWIDTASALVTAENVIHVASDIITDVDALQAAIVGDLQTHQFDCIPNNCKVTTMVFEKLNGTFGPVTKTSSAPEGGGDTGQVSPQVAALVKLFTDTAGRRARGRIFLPFVAEASQENGILNGTVHDNMQSAWLAYIAALTADGVALSVNSRVDAQLRPVTATMVETSLATQRRRQGRLRRG